jgi:sec-independent protein translocase protein TatA
MLQQITPIPAMPLGQFQFFNIGTPEMIVIMIVALLVFGPRKLPEIGRQIGGAMREFKKFSSDVQDTFNLRDHLDVDRHLSNTNASYDNTYHQYDSYGEEINTPPTEYPALDQYGLDATPDIATDVAPNLDAEPVAKPKRTRKAKVASIESVEGNGDISVTNMLATEITDAPEKIVKKRAPRAKKVVDSTENTEVFETTEI